MKAGLEANSTLEEKFCKAEADLNLACSKCTDNYFMESVSCQK